MFQKKSEVYREKKVTLVSGLGDFSLRDTLECGQAFRYEKLVDEGDYVEYLTVAMGRIMQVGQDKAGELIFYGEWDEDFEATVTKYFALDTDYEAIRRDVVSRTDSQWLKDASEAARGIVILRQEPWEALFSFIISQNNNIPRIRKIIRKISSEYGENLAEKYGLETCPTGKVGAYPGCAECKNCGICYSFPTPEQVLERPEGLLPAKPGFRYKYLMDAAEKVHSGEVNLAEIEQAKSYETTLTELKKILGVGDKVASCAALFGFGNLEAFPIDVWMKRAIDDYFEGRLDPKTLGPYAGVAQQYIFHYIRNLNEK